MKWLKKKITNLFYDWDLINKITSKAVEESEKSLYRDLSNRINIEDTIKGLQEIQKKNPTEKYTAIASLICIQSREIVGKKHRVPGWDKSELI